MSTISHTKFLAQLRRWGVEFVEHSRQDRCLGRTVPWYQHEARRSRDCARRGWDAHGIAIHHTGGPTSWTYVWDGDISGRGIPGPLYITEIYEDGVAHLTGWGVSNNVGACDKTVRDRVLAGKMPTSGEVRPGGDDYQAANSEFYGLAYRGTRPNAAQRATMRRICAAVCEAHGPDWDGGSIAGHRELTRRKPDPEGEDMGRFRADVNALLKTGPSGSGSTGGDDDMATPYETWAYKNEKITDRDAYSYLRAGEELARRAAAGTATLIAGQAALKAAIADLAKAIADQQGFDPEAFAQLVQEHADAGAEAALQRMIADARVELVVDDQ